MNVKEKINQFWNNRTTSIRPTRTRWWEIPLIRKHINHLVSGQYVDGNSQGLIIKLKELNKTFPLAVSVGCGNGHKEMNLIKNGLVDKFILFELSDERIKQGKKLASDLGISDKVEFRTDDFISSISTNSVDMVHWNNSLHHMFDVNQSIKWSYDVLKSGGVFYMDDFIGPARFQWSDDALELASHIRSVLPEKYLINPHSPEKLIGRKVGRIDPDKLINDDPSEAVESDKIISCVKNYFPRADITYTGGIVYHTTLNDVIHNMDEQNETDKTILELLLIIDKLTTKTTHIESQYATALAVKPTPY